jgi:hypothetical protein
MVRRRALFGILTILVAAPPLRADAFDRYINSILTKVPDAQGVKELKQLTPELISDNDQVLTGLTGAFLVVKTNDGRYSKLLVQLARQKIDADSSIPILLIDHYVTYREGQEQTTYTKGQNVSLFPGFRFNLDIGQVVPPKLGGDLRFVAEGGKTYVEPLGKAKHYLVTQPLPQAAPKKATKLVVGEVFEPRYFNGTYKLYDDGRRSGKLTLRVADNGEVTGAYYSDKDGQKYEVKGKISTPKHAIQFTVKFPQSVQTFQGMLFTGDGKALTGTSRLQDRETGFYALRVDEE